MESADVVKIGICIFIPILAVLLVGKRYIYVQAKS